MMQSGLEDWLQHLGGKCLFYIFYLKDGDRRLLWNSDTYLPDYMVFNLRRSYHLNIGQAENNKFNTGYTAAARS
jgi:hypothetical protein